MLEGKVAIITGASRGIGRAIAKELSSAGVSVCIAARNEKNLNDLAREIRELGGNALPVVCDLYEESSVDKIVDECAKAYGKIDYLVNNAAYSRSAKLMTVTKEDFDRHMYLNAFVPLRMIQKTEPYLKESDSAYVINIASVVAFNPYENQGAYSASKHALSAFSKVAAKELFDSNIRISMISPGAVDTELITEMRPDLKDTSAFSKPEEIAKMVRFLLENRNNSVIDEIVVRRYSKKP